MKNKAASEMGKLSVKSRFGNLNDEQKKEYMSYVRMKRYGYTWNKESKKCIKPDLGIAFNDNISK